MVYGPLPCVRRLLREAEPGVPLAEKAQLDEYLDNAPHDERDERAKDRIRRVVVVDAVVVRDMVSSRRGVTRRRSASSGRGANY